MLSFSLERRRKFFDQASDLTLDLVLLFVDQAKARENQRDVPGAGLGDARGHSQWLGTQNFARLLCADASNAVLFEQRAELRQAEASSQLGRRCHLEQLPEPGSVVDAAELENLRKVTVKLLAQLIAKPDALCSEALLHAAQLA